VWVIGPQIAPDGGYVAGKIRSMFEIKPEHIKSHRAAGFRRCKLFVARV
jgi:hypothetical protein